MFYNTVKVSEASEFCKPMGVGQRWPARWVCLDTGIFLTPSICPPPHTQHRHFWSALSRSRHQDRMTQLRTLLETHLWENGEGSQTLMQVCLSGERGDGRKGGGAGCCSYSAVTSKRSLAGPWEVGLGENRKGLKPMSPVRGVPHLLGIRAKSLHCYPILCDPIHCSPPGSSVHGILQARILGGLLCPSPGDLPHPEIERASLMSPALAGRFFTTSAMWEGLPWYPKRVQSLGESSPWEAWPRPRLGDDLQSSTSGALCFNYAPCNWWSEKLIPLDTHHPRGDLSLQIYFRLVFSAWRISGTEEPGGLLSMGLQSQMLLSN